MIESDSSGVATAVSSAAGVSSTGSAACSTAVVSVSGKKGNQ